MTPDGPQRYSHPPEGDATATLLTDHLADVADRCETLIPEPVTTAREEQLATVAQQTAWCHDFGKLTTWFQQHIGMESGDPPDDKPTTHSFLGAHAAYYCLKASGRSPTTCLAGYLAIAKHHGVLPDAVDYIYDKYRENPSGERNRAHVLTQVNDIDDCVPGRADDIIREASGREGSWDAFLTEIREESLFDTIRDDVAGGEIVPTKDPEALPREFYDEVLQLWSALVFADKTSAADAPLVDGSEPQLSALNDHIDGLEGAESSREQRLNDAREQARQEVLGNVEDFVTGDKSIATLTLPTGLGKTLTGLNAALEARDAQGGGRVVYALPFTSIVDQVADDMMSIWSTESGGATLTVHHHLADTAIDPGAGGDTSEATDADAQVQEMLGESWRSGVTVTTFVQLFESLAGPRNSQSMKLPALYNSVIVLDEPQSLPHAWWSLVQRLLEILTERYDATVIAMTATQPALFDDSPELVDDTDRYYRDEAFHRVQYRLDKSVGRFDSGEPIGYQEAAAEIVKASQDTSVLAVCNTIDSAQYLTRKTLMQIEAVDVGSVYADRLSADGVPPSGETLADAIEARGDTAVLHLSTRLRPVDRLRLIEAAKELTSRRYPLVAVTTQLVEAGVDISFGHVFRDLAPMDSIVQAAGRCNRNFERNRGEVTVWWLAATDDKDVTPGAAVYDRWRGNSLLSMTAEVLDDLVATDETVSEDTIAWEAVQRYYGELDDRDPGREEPVGWVDRAEAAKLGGESLIDTRTSAEVIVCRTENDWQNIERAREAWRERRYREVDKVLDALRSRQVSVPIYDEDGPEAEMVRDIPPLHGDADLRVLDARDSHQYFDEVQGLVAAEDGAEARFL